MWILNLVSSKCYIIDSENNFPGCLRRSGVLRNLLLQFFFCFFSSKLHFDSLSHSLWLHTDQLAGLALYSLRIVGKFIVYIKCCIFWKRLLFIKQLITWTLKHSGYTCGLENFHRKTTQYLGRFELEWQISTLMISLHIWYIYTACLNLYFWDLHIRQIVVC